jgi:hypothetical protein
LFVEVLANVLVGQVETKCHVLKVVFGTIQGLAMKVGVVVEKSMLVQAAADLGLLLMKEDHQRAFWCGVY